MPHRMRTLLLSAVSLFVLASVAGGCSCGPGPSSEEDGGEVVLDAGEDAGLGEDAGADAGAGFVAITEIARDAGVILERFTYVSGELSIEGAQCRPEAPGEHAAILRNHGGFNGLPADPFDVFCLAMARDGYVVSSSAYRGEGQSDGGIEVCAGEVDDVQTLISLLGKSGYVNPGQIGAIGEGAHGGCVTLELAVREPSLKAAVDLSGIGDLGAAHRFWDKQILNNEPPPCPADAGDTCGFTHRQLLNTVEGAIGGRPSNFPLSYDARSPTLWLGTVSAPLLIVQGTADYVTALDQACGKVQALVAGGKPVAAWYFNSALDAVAAPSVCDGSFRTDAAPDPKSAGSMNAADRFLLVYEGEGQLFSEPAQTHVSAYVLRFLRDKLNP